VNVGHSPAFSSYVEGVNIGPERIHSGLRTFLSGASGPQTDHFEQEGAAAWQILVREQKDFDATRKTSTMLEDAFFAFENLKHIHIDSYPDKKDDAARRKAWGAKFILRQLGVTSSDARYSFLDEVNGTNRLHGHYDRVLDALRGIRRDNKNWTLEISLNSVNLCYERPFGLCPGI
jgi:hypothetical protein